MKHLRHALSLTATITALATVPPPAPATIVRAAPIVIDVCGHGGIGRAFTLSERSPRGLRISDDGTAVLSVGKRRPQHDSSGRVRRLAGTEILHGRHGTLTLALGGQPSQDRQRRRVVGTWIATGGTGAYAGFMGHGEFASDGLGGSGRYSGVLITAV